MIFCTNGVYILQNLNTNLRLIWTLHTCILAQHTIHIYKYVTHMCVVPYNCIPPSISQGGSDIAGHGKVLPWKVFPHYWPLWLLVVFLTKRQYNAYLTIVFFNPRKLFKICPVAVTTDNTATPTTDDQLSFAWTIVYRQTINQIIKWQIFLRQNNVPKNMSIVTTNRYTLFLRKADSMMIIIIWVMRRNTMANWPCLCWLIWRNSTLFIPFSFGKYPFTLSKRPNTRHFLFFFFSG